MHKMRTTENSSNTTLLSKIKYGAKEKERMPLYVPNREIVISKLLYFWQVCRCIYCSKIPNVKLIQVQQVCMDEMKNMNVLKEAAIKAAQQEILYQHWTNTWALLIKDGMITLRLYMKR